MAPDASDPGGDGAGPDLDLFGRASARHRDWSHRRQEPRGLALMWTVYLMLATVVSLAPMVLAGQLSGSVYRPAARTMMVLVAFGVAVLWPVWRASQAPQRSAPVLDVARDLSVLVVPALVLLWPQVLLAGWPVGVVGAVSVTLVVWLFASGAVLLWWHRFSDDGWKGRAAVAGFSVLLAGAVPLALLATGALALGPPGPAVSEGWMWSPLTAVWEVLRDRGWSGAPAAVASSHWGVLRIQAIGVTAVAALSVWCCRGRSRVG